MSRNPNQVSKIRAERAIRHMISKDPGLSETLFHCTARLERNGPTTFDLVVNGKKGAVSKNIGSQLKKQLTDNFVRSAGAVSVDTGEHENSDRALQMLTIANLNVSKNKLEDFGVVG